MATPCYIFDVDGTLANNKHRTHHLEKTPKDWDAYHKRAHIDTPFMHMCSLVADFVLYSRPVVFCTGRHEGQRELTVEWLRYNCCPAVELSRWSPPLYMRKEGDHRPDHIVKRELLDQICADGWEPIMVFDDRSSVVKMWREAGVPCAQVAEGDF